MGDVEAVGAVDCRAIDLAAADHHDLVLLRLPRRLLRKLSAASSVGDDSTLLRGRKSCLAETTILSRPASGLPIDS